MKQMTMTEIITAFARLTFNFHISMMNRPARNNEAQVRSRENESSDENDYQFRVEVILFPMIVTFPPSSSSGGGGALDFRLPSRMTINEKKMKRVPRTLEKREGPGWPPARTGN